MTSVTKWCAELENLNRPIPSKEIEAVTKSLQKESPGLNGFAGAFYQIFKELTPVLLTLFQKFDQSRVFPNSIL